MEQFESFINSEIQCFCAFCSKAGFNSQSNSMAVASSCFQSSCSQSHLKIIFVFSLCLSHVISSCWFSSPLSLSTPKLPNYHQVSPSLPTTTKPLSLSFLPYRWATTSTGHIYPRLLTVMVSQMLMRCFHPAYFLSTFAPLNSLAFLYKGAKVELENSYADQERQL